MSNTGAAHSPQEGIYCVVMAWLGKEEFKGRLETLGEGKDDLSLGSNWSKTSADELDSGSEVERLIKEKGDEADEGCLEYFGGNS